jgi:hypothetical protein
MPSCAHFPFLLFVYVLFCYVTLRARNAVSCFHYMFVQFHCVLSVSDGGFKHVTGKAGGMKEEDR